MALTVTPALALLLLSGAPLERRESPLVGWLQRGYTAVLARVVQQPRRAYPALGVIALVGLAAVPRLGGGPVLPSLQDRNLLIHWEGAPGTSQPEMDRITARATRELRAIPGVRNVGAHVGRAVTSDQVVGANAGEIWLSLGPTADYTATVAAVRDVVDGYPGLHRSLLTYPQEKVREVRTGADQPLVVRVYGQDLGVLHSKAEEVRQLLSKVSGVVDPHLDLEADEPTVEIEVNLAAARHYGIKPGDVRRAAATLLSGLGAGSLYEQQKVFEVVVRGTPSTRNSLTSIRGLLIDTPGGGHVRLGDVAQVRIRPSPNVIRHNDVSRRIDVGAGVHGRALGAVTHDVQRRLREVRFPLEYHAEVLGGGGYAQRQDAQGRWLGAAVAAAVLAFLLLQAAFGSWRLASVLFLTLPLALVGGVVAAVVAARGISSAELLVGLLAVLGIAVRNGVLLIGHYQRLQRQEGGAPGPELVLRGSRERLAPVLMTALATGLALLPFVVSGSIPGHETVHPLAVVIEGGLVTSTLFSLFVLPFLYLRCAPRPQGNRARPGSPWTSTALLVVGLVCSLGLSACAQASGSSENGGDGGKQAKIERIAGTDLSRVTLSRRAEERLGIRTTPVREAGTPPAQAATAVGKGGKAVAAGRKVVPYAAVLYDSHGVAWVYTNPAPRTFVRRRITVDYIQGNLAVLSDGPPAGTAVVTVGAAELLGAELGVGE